MRLFVAVPLPPDVQDALGRLQGGVPGARWVKPVNMHLTLRFLGETSETDAGHLDDALSVLHEPAFEVTVAGVGVFESRHGPRVLWAGVKPSPALMHLQDKVERCAQVLGFGAEARQFAPHITLARFKSKPGKRLGEFIEAHHPFQAPPFMADRFTLFESKTGNEAPHYVPLNDYDLLDA